MNKKKEKYCYYCFLLEKRARFDAGDDPLDAEEQAQQHNPFRGFNPFGGGNSQGFTFRFHFE